MSKLIELKKGFWVQADKVRSVYVETRIISLAPKPELVMTYELRAELELGVTVQNGNGLFIRPYEVREDADAEASRLSELVNEAVNGDA